MREPSRHNHGGHMVWDDDWCGCKVCNQQWQLGQYGWVPLDRNGHPIVSRPAFKKADPKKKAPYPNRRRS